MSLCEMLGGIRAAFRVPMKLTWVTIPWIGRQDVIDEQALTWSMWRFSRDDAIKSDKAVAQGLTYRPLHTTAVDTLAWHNALPAERQARFFIGAKKDKDGKWHSVFTPWAEILEREQAILARWRVHRARQ